MSQPEAGRPHVPEYGIPETLEGVLPWSHAVERLERARNLWIVTVGPGPRPHARPVWGVWVDGAVYFGGGPQTRWARNLAAHPDVVVHLESGDEVVILEGRVGRVDDPDDVVARVIDAYEAKYDFRHPAPFWELRPDVAFAWTDFPRDTTRWRFFP